eukprot:TRINITY_DN33777_c0_g1_i1.p1 TRINITY_DN33777_c0_g1~~TRINITY_DN33777_c0_g1_i1.p1  ORF type:complete len:368 (+),score=124.20 TRINITY_DN33777_c0_g1_i1:80-1183(+)
MSARRFGKSARQMGAAPFTPLSREMKGLVGKHRMYKGAGPFQKKEGSPGPTGEFTGARRVQAERIGRSPLSGVRVMRMFKRNDGIGHTQMTMKNQTMFKKFMNMRDGAVARETNFEKEIISNAVFDEVQLREKAMRSGSDMPLDGENPYSSGADYRLLRDAQLREIVPHLMQKLKYTHASVVRRCVLELELKYPTLKDLFRAMQRDTDGELVWELREKFGSTWVHVELFTRAAMVQAEVRQDIIRRNAKGILTTAANQRVYAPPGCFRFSYKPIRTDPGHSTTETADTSSYGPWRFYRSDFGLNADGAIKETHFLNQNTDAFANNNFGLRDQYYAHKTRRGHMGGLVRPGNMQVTSKFTAGASRTEG